jgi:hypothetical protein
LPPVPPQVSSPLVLADALHVFGRVVLILYFLLFVVLVIGCRIGVGIRHELGAWRREREARLPGDSIGAR